MTQLLNLFRSVCVRNHVSTSAVLYLKTKLFLVGLRKLPRARGVVGGEKGRKPRVTLKLIMSFSLAEGWWSLSFVAKSCNCS